MQPVQREAVWPGVIEEDCMWAIADQGSYKMALRRAYKNSQELNKTAEELKDIIDTKFSDEVLFEGFIERLIQEEKDEDTVIL